MANDYEPAVLRVSIDGELWQVGLKVSSSGYPRHVMATNMIGEYVGLREYTRMRQDYEQQRETNHRIIGILVEQNRERANLLAALLEVEWVLTPISTGINCAVYKCPWCKQRETNGHADDCSRQAAIAKAREEVEQCASP